jgi:hypothetical protein
LGKQTNGFVGGSESGMFLLSENIGTVPENDGIKCMYLNI